MKGIPLNLDKVEKQPLTRPNANRELRMKITGISTYMVEVPVRRELMITSLVLAVRAGSIIEAVSENPRDSSVFTKTHLPPAKLTTSL